MQEDISYFTDKIVLIPKREIVTYDYIAESKDLPYERIDALNKIYTGEADVIITTIEALMQRIIPKELLYKDIIKFEISKTYDLEELKKNLVNLGYTRIDLIEAKGQFSLRGGILDIAITDKMGVRIEFWGDDVDSIRYFNILNQRSTKEIKDITIYPAHEFVLEKDLEEVCQDIKKRFLDDNCICNNEENISKYKDNIEADIELIKTGNYISKIDKYYDSFYKHTTNLLDYINEDNIIYLDEIRKIKARSKNVLIDNENVQKMLIEKEKIIPDVIKKLYEYDEIIKDILKRKTIYLEKQDLDFADEETKEARKNGINFRTREVNYYKSSMEIFLEEAQTAINEKKTVVVLAGDAENAKKLSLLLLEKEIPHKYIENLENESEIKNIINNKYNIEKDVINKEERKDITNINNNIEVPKNTIPKSVVIVSVGTLSTGFEGYDFNLLVISSKELFSKDSKRRKKAHSSFSEGEKVVFADLKIGDYVVHKSHGIGQFIGVNTIKADNVTKDYIKIKYKDDDILYIPTSGLDNIRKYIGGGEKEPKLNRLGSKEWFNTKRKVKSNLQEVAKNLIELYAKRQKIKGFAFEKDTPWQTQFEDSFPYVETDDQLRCIEEVKKDMEQEKPMDRLLCGDVRIWENRSSNKGCV